MVYTSKACRALSSATALEDKQMELKVFDRTQTAASLRLDGMLPAVVYDKSAPMV
jgi:hypothetical protein